ncbi:MAG: nucleoside-diphosphate kinase [Planctomycetaceae bacterium]|nr:nucleoside-diphosphate kinase [Planctomycetaceae bacterium]
MTTQQTLVLLKPDAVKRQLIGQILSRFEQKGLKIINLRWFRFTQELARQHYAEHIGKPFYSGLEEYVMSGAAVAVILEGPEAVAVVRRLIGPTNGVEASPGTIRGDFSLSNQQNLVHASDSSASAEREIKIFFPAV